MLSALQQRKLTTLFQNLDADNGGMLTEEDFRLVLDKLATSLGLKANSLQYAYLRTILLSLWKKVSLADENSDAKVTLEEWLKYYENLIKSDTYEKNLQSQCDVLFPLLDENEDGKISKQEYVDLVSAYGVDASLANQNFDQLDLNGDGHISKEELFALMDEFFRSDDPQAPGNLFWGSY